MSLYKSERINKDGFTFTVFEIVPLERLGIGEFKEGIKNIMDALTNTSFKPIECENSNNAKIFRIKDKIDNEDRPKKTSIESKEEYKTEEELVWELRDFCDYLIINSKIGNVLFALASTRDPESWGSITPNYVAQLFGTYIYPPSLARIICADALKDFGLVKLSNNINVCSSAPRETALAGDITFNETPIHPLGGYNLKYIGTDIEIRPISLLNSKLLLTQNIIELIQNESLLNNLELAKLYPLQLAQADIFLQNKSFSLFNYIMINARFGTQFDILDEMLNISLHLNWQFAKNSDEELTKNLALSYAHKQKKRFELIEKREHAIRSALNTLQKRYPLNSDLIQWEINNIYSNITKYSPIFIHFKSHLKSFIQDERDSWNEYNNLISTLDWISLAKNGIANINDGKRIIKLLHTDPGIILMKIRIIIEKIIKYTYKSKCGPNDADLGTMIYELNQKNIFPPILHVFINSLRISGNLGAHELSDSIGSKKDIEAIMPIFIRIVEWFLDQILNIRMNTY
ncbi:MAG: DUF4145 domain-containing protein [Promethearchaeota archaeon]